MQNNIYIHTLYTSSSFHLVKVTNLRLIYKNEKAECSQKLVNIACLSERYRNEQVGLDKATHCHNHLFTFNISFYQVRATNLQELVYKNGQAGVTKATVSITFDNKDKKQSPLGYEQYDEITITRQVRNIKVQKVNIKLMMLGEIVQAFELLNGWLCDYPSSVS